MQTSETTSVHSEELEQRVIRKVSRRLLPFMGVLFFINYLDRTNIGFGKLTMSKDLGLTDTMFGLASGLFFVGYLCFEVPSNLALHRFGARRWMARIMVTWGVVAACMAFVPTAGWLYGLRVVLGVAEAGFFPGMLLYLTFWFPRKERVRLTALFLLAVPISSALGAPLSAAVIQYGDGLFGLAGWRVMYLVEGLPAVLLGLMTWFYLTDRPAQAGWLSVQERSWLTTTMDAENRTTAERFHWPLRRALTDPHVWGLGFVYFGAVYGLYALSFFLPTIVAGFAQTFHTTYSLFETGLIVAVPFAVGAVAMVVWSRHSDRTGERVWHVAAPMLLGAASIPVALYLQSPFAVMVAVTLTAVGIFSALPVFWYLPTTFLSGVGAAAGIALVNSLGNAGGFAAPFVTGLLSDATGSKKTGMWVVGLAMFLAAILVLLLHAVPGPGHEVDQPDIAVDRPSLEADHLV
jgi:MFS transporter, ACS family, tartrate transporter